MKTRLSAKIDLVNQLCELPLTPRDNNGRIIDPLTTSIQKIFSTVSKTSNSLQCKLTFTVYFDYNIFRHGIDSTRFV